MTICEHSGPVSRKECDPCKIIRLEKEIERLNSLNNIMHTRSCFVAQNKKLIRELEESNKKVDDFKFMITRVIDILTVYDKEYDDAGIKYAINIMKENKLALKQER